MRRTAAELMGTPGTNMGEALDGAEFALEMIRFPYRQVFGDPSQGSPGSIIDVFRPSLSMVQLKARFMEAIE
jgi:hypothetical protein